MEYTVSVLEAVKKAVKKYPNDVAKSIELAIKNVRKLSEYKALVNNLVDGAIQDIVYDTRHQENKQIKSAAGLYGAPAKIVIGNSKAVQESARSVYDMFINGTTLGVVLGVDLETIAFNEQNIADGYSFNAAVCRRLSGMVPADKMVKEAVSEKKLRAIFKAVHTSIDTGGVGAA